MAKGQGPVRMSDRIAAQLTEEIIRGQNREPGALRLGSLAKRLDVSTTPVREALASLERQGLVTGQIHRGFEVAHLSPTDIGDLYEMHAFILRTLAERAATNMSDDAISEVEDLDRTLTQAIRDRDVDLAGSTNHEIHRRINDASQSPLLLRFLRASAPFIASTGEIISIDKLSPKTASHAPILKALRSRDAQTAGELMFDHVMHNGRAAVRMVEREQGARDPSGRRRRP